MTPTSETTARLMSTHWDDVYTGKEPDAVSWFAPRLERSLAMIGEAAAQGDGLSSRIIDVGAGAGTLVDDLLGAGFMEISLLDIAAEALEHSKRRLGSAAEALSWHVGDITQLALPHHAYDIWHDRAVFHFLTDPADKARYIAQVRHAVRPGGHVIVGTFGAHGPEKCSGLHVARYSPEALHATFGDPFTKLDHVIERHQTPWGSDQEFTWCHCRID